MVQEFRKKDIVVKAEQFFLNKRLPFAESNACRLDSEGWYVLTAHFHRTPIVPGDWVIEELNGLGHYPCKPDIFEATYDLVTRPLVQGLDKFWSAQSEWSQATFGSDQVRGPQGPLKHLAKEVNEALQDPKDLMEYVDMQFLIFDACRRAGHSYQELLEGCWKKLEVNKSREWGPASLTEAVEHKRS